MYCTVQYTLKSGIANRGHFKKGIPRTLEQSLFTSSFVINRIEVGSAPHRVGGACAFCNLSVLLQS
jgi:hypothetical protein